MDPFAVQKLVRLIRAQFFLILFLLPWETDLRTHCYHLCQRMFYLCSRGFMISCIIFKYLGHFELIFVYGVRECSNFIDLREALIFPNTNCWRLLLIPYVFTVIHIISPYDHNHLNGYVVGILP